MKDVDWPKDPVSIQNRRIAEAQLVHARALAAHCECLGMNAEDCAAIIIGSAPPFTNADYAKVLEKWKLINDKGEPLI